MKKVIMIIFLCVVSVAVWAIDPVPPEQVKNSSEPVKTEPMKEPMTSVKSASDYRHEAGKINGFTRYYNEDGLYSIEFPSDWKFIVNNKMLGGVDETPLNRDFKDNVLVTAVPLDKDYKLQEFFDENLDQMKKSFTDFTVVSTDHIKVANMDAIRVVFTLTTSDSHLNLKAVQVYLIKDKHAFLFEGTTLASEYDKLAGIFDQVVNSLQIENQSMK